MVGSDVGVDHCIGRKALAHELLACGSHLAPLHGIVQQLADRRREVVRVEARDPHTRELAHPAHRGRDDGRARGERFQDGDRLAFGVRGDEQELGAGQQRAGVVARAEEGHAGRVQLVAQRAVADDDELRLGHAPRHLEEPPGVLDRLEPADEQHALAAGTGFARWRWVDAVVDHARDGRRERRQDALGDHDDLVSGAQQQLRGARAVVRGGAVVGGEQRRAARAAREPERRGRNHRRLRVVGMHDVRAEGADECCLSGGPFHDTERRAAALGEDEPLDVPQLRVERPGSA